MKLELKHLAPYLPYKLKVQETETDQIFEVDGFSVDSNELLIINTYDDEEYDIENYCLEYLKPVLKPLSQYSDINSPAMVKLNSDLTDQMNICELAEGLIYWNKLPQHTIEVMASEHIDYMGLIEQGLAISIESPELLEAVNNG